MSGGSAAQADVVLALEGGDIANVARQARQRNAKVVSITATHLFQRSNYQDFQRSGTPGSSFASGVPAYRATILGDADLADVRAYLASLPPPVAEIPLLAR